MNLIFQEKNQISISYEIQNHLKCVVTITKVLYILSDFADLFIVYLKFLCTSLTILVWDTRTLVVAKLQQVHGSVDGIPLTASSHLLVWLAFTSCV